MNLINHIAQAWWGWMGPMFWQVSLLILIISAIDMMIRRWAWPQIRYALWLLVLVKLLIPPTWSLPSGIIARFQPLAQARIEQQWNKTFHATGEKKIYGQTATPSNARSAQSIEPAAVKSSKDGLAEPSLRTGKVKPVWQVYTLGFWILGMVLFIALLMMRITKLRRWHKQQKEKKAIPVWFHKLLIQTTHRLKLGLLPAIVFSDEAVTPAVYGVFRPVLLLPANYLDTLSREEAEHVLLHELAHLKRGDLWIHGLCLLLQIVYWFNPLLVWARKQMKYVREICCDLTLANLLREKTKKYRQTLLNTARELLTESVEPGMGLLGVFEEPFRLVARLKWLKKKTWQNRKLITATVCCVTLTMMAFVLPMAGGKQSSSDVIGITGSAEKSISHEEKSQAAEMPLKQEQGDVYIREVYRTNSYILWILAHSEMTQLSEIWIRDQKLALSEKSDSFNRKIILDLKNNLIFFINHRDKTYVEATLPLDSSRILSEQLKWRNLEVKLSGQVKETNRTKIFLNKKCNEYKATYWDMRGDKKFNRRTFKVWCTTDLSFDFSIYQELLINMRKISRKDENLRKELQKLKGIQMGVEMKSSRIFASRKFISEVVEISRKEPTEAMYSVPEGYTKKERLTSWDL